MQASNSFLMLHALFVAQPPLIDDEFLQRLNLKMLKEGSQEFGRVTVEMSKDERFGECNILACNGYTSGNFLLYFLLGHLW
jgi:hypothetical protein